MRKFGILVAAFLLIHFKTYADNNWQEINTPMRILQNIAIKYGYAPLPEYSLDEIEALLKNNGLPGPVVLKVISSIECANAYNVQHNSILSVIDYSKPSNEKRMWVFDLDDKKLLFNTYVSHGIKSGALKTDYFSNKNDSKASSLGVYKTQGVYYGREGLSLKLEGLERGFNDNAFNRAIVMHGGWYMDENFIKKYGRAGRSWGCPALPLDLAVPILNTIKDSSWFVVYYPEDKWLKQSKFLNCQSISPLNRNVSFEGDKVLNPDINQPREPILFADLKVKNKQEAQGAVLAMEASRYQDAFQTIPPLARMIRRQVNHLEYIALSSTEFKQLASKEDSEKWLKNLQFVIAVVKMNRGYYITEMQLVPKGTIKNIQVDVTSQTDKKEIYKVQFESASSLILNANTNFVRWVGL